MPEATPEELIERWQEFLRESELLPRVMALADAYPEERALELEFAVVDRFDADLGLALLEKPLAALYAAEEAIRRSVPPSDEPIALRLRVKGLPKDSRVEIRELRSKHLGKFLSLSGLVRKVTEVRPKVVEALFQCLRCNAVIKEEQEGLSFREPLECYKDEGGCGRSAGATKFVLLTENSRYMDTQKVEIQEAPEGLRGGEQPQRLTAYLDDDLTGKINPGARVILNGVLRSVQKGRAPAKSTLFDLFLDVDSLELQQVEFEEIEVSPEDVAKIKKEAEDPEVFTKIVGSIAPSIFGLGTEKEALALQLFGGVPKVMPDGRRIRGDQHILLIGDPGTGKSELLAYMSRLSPRGIYASGQAASGPGLTAAAVRDEFGEGRWTLEAGAMVLADKGLACLHPDMEVIMDGRPIAIEHLFDESQAIEVLANGRRIEISPLNLRTVSLDVNRLEVRTSRTTLVTRRRYDGPIIRLTLDSGFELRLTPDHLVLDGTTLAWKQVQDLGLGSRLVALQRLPGSTEPVYILDILPEDWIVQPTRVEKTELKAGLLTRFRRLSDINRHYGLKRDALSGRGAMRVGQFRRILNDLHLFDSWKKRPFGYGRSKSTERLRVGTITPELAYVLGFIFGDGHVTIDDRHSSVAIYQSRSHPLYIRKVLQLSKEVFSRPWGMYERETESRIRGTAVRSRGYIMHRGSDLLAYLYVWLANHDLANLLLLDDAALRGFIAGSMDSDGSISVRRSHEGPTEYENVDIEFLISASRRANLRFMLALRRFDVFARLRDGVGVFHVQVTSRNDAQRLLTCIMPYSAKWKPIPGRKHTNPGAHEEVPALCVARALEGVQPKPWRLLPKAFWSTLYDLKHSKRTGFKDSLRKLALALAPIATDDQIDRLNVLTGSDYALDRIVGMKTEDYNGYVYDLRVPDGENFVCEGIASHNCIDEIEKMNPQDRSSIHEILEQQRLSVAKAGITATLQARCALLAAANPKFGRFDEHKYISEQIDLPVTLLSVSGDTPVLVRRAGRIQSMSMSGLIDPYYADGRDGHPIPVQDLEVPSLDLDSLKVGWRRASEVFRHRFQGDLLKIQLETGRVVTVTSGHSIYGFKNGRIVAIPGDRLKVGDLIAIPRAIPPSSFAPEEFLLPRELLRLSPELRKGVYLHDVPAGAFPGLSNLKGHWISRRMLPLEYADRLSDEDLRNCTLKVLGGTSNPAPPVIQIDADLMRFLGYFIAEGSALISPSRQHMISFALGPKDRAIVEDLRGIVQRTFGAKIQEFYKGTSWRVTIRNKIAYSFLVHVLGVALGAHRKCVPHVVFNAKPVLQMEFIEAYWAGDAGVTVSRHLISDLLYLFLFQETVASTYFDGRTRTAFIRGRPITSHGHYQLVSPRPPSLKNRGRFGGIPMPMMIGMFRSLSDSDIASTFLGVSSFDRGPRKITPYWWRQFLGRRITGRIRRLETLTGWTTQAGYERSLRLRDGGGQPFVEMWRRRGLLLRRERPNRQSPYYYRLSDQAMGVLGDAKFINRYLGSDVLLVRIKRLTRSGTNEFVYDLSVPGNENFIAGVGGIVCHNSRFDSIFPIMDRPESSRDRAMADHILKAHLVGEMRRKQEEQEPSLAIDPNLARPFEPHFPPDFLRKYVAYAKRVYPIMTPDAMKAITDKYLEIRRQGEMEGAAVPITPRQLEAFVRMSEASARARLSPLVGIEDAERAVRIVEYWLQKVTGIEGRFDIDIVATGVSTSQREQIIILRDIIQELAGAEGTADLGDIVERAEQRGIPAAKVEQYLKRWQQEGEVYSPARNKYRLITRS